MVHAMTTKRVLMGPGPSDVPTEVLEALARPTIGHLDPRFVDMMDEIKELTKKPGSICFNCGRVADSDSNLCNPMPLD